MLVRVLTNTADFAPEITAITMSAEESKAPIQDFDKIIQLLEDEVEQLYKFRDFFFEIHPLEMASEKHALVKQKVATMCETFDLLDESDVPINLRAKYLYIKGRCFNVVLEYDPRALECFSKAVKLNPDLIEAWNELGESYFKNMNIKEAQACLEGSLKRKRDRVTLRNLSILLRLQATDHPEDLSHIVRSVEYAKEAVSLDPTDGTSWSILGNAFMCQYFSVKQLPTTLKSAMSAYKQAWTDAKARGTCDLPYNKGVAHNYGESFEEAMDCFEFAHRLEPSWQPPIKQMQRLIHYLRHVDDIVNSKGRIKNKRLQQMVQSMDRKLYGEYLPGAQCTLNKRKVTLQKMNISELIDGINEEKVVMGRVIGSYLSENTIPFTFAIVDESMSCIAVNVYNWADGRGVIIGDCVCIPEPSVSTHVQKKKLSDIGDASGYIGDNKDSKSKKPEKMYNFRTIRINNPLNMLINGKRPGTNQYAGTRVTTTMEAH